MTETALAVRRHKNRETGERLPDLKYEVPKTQAYLDWWNAFATDDLRRAYETWPIDTFRRSSCFDGLAQFLKANNFKGRRCVEIGTSNGFTAIIFARLFDEVVTIDIEPNDMKRKIASDLGIRNIVFHDVARNKDKKRIVQHMPFDAAYVDGNHQDDTPEDFEMVKRCGLVLFHECWPLQPPVWNLVQSLPQEQVVYGGRTHAIWDARRK